MSSRGVIIVAGGSGTRLGADKPKQFLTVGGKEILVHTLERFLAVPEVGKVVVVLPEEWIEEWREIAARYGLAESHTVCAGGDSRIGSVRNGLAALGECDLVAVHDGVRPFVSAAMIERGFEVAEEFGSAIPVVEVVDTIRKVGAEGSEIVNRSELRAVQTPQIFDGEVLRAAYASCRSERYTDDGSVVERWLSSRGGQLAFYAGERNNIKITYAEDLTLAEFLLAKR
ncbi:MAG: 2-C-methyl-D-erythritol 4-phosphate cytidylyltransferase [Tidjanibacter sp.]|nr:2-C-methyl-D-erythritol 4-phosphate cytidylyltransferase [Tidjanibacter sp.]